MATRLPKLVTLKGGHLGPYAPRLSGIGFESGLFKTTEATLEERYAVVPPFGSTYEVAVWEYISKQNPYWVPQQQVGRYGTRGSTSIDFYNNMLQIALQVDGAYIHSHRTAADTYINEQLRARGMKVVRWTFYSLEDVVNRRAQLYLRDIGK
jgi:very-short-patch-repair endonuclease